MFSKIHQLSIVCFFSNILLVNYIFVIDQCFSTGVPQKQTEIAWDEIRNHSYLRL